jgi:hypothetical protein
VETDYPFGDEVNISAVAGSAGLPVLVRIPGWLGGANSSGELVVEGQPPMSLAGKNGTMLRIGVASAGGGTLHATLRMRPAIRIEQWAAGAYSVHRGALMVSAARFEPAPVRSPQPDSERRRLCFLLTGARVPPEQFALPIEPNYTVVAHHYGSANMSNTYDTTGLSPWRFALDASPDNPSASLRFETSGQGSQAAPFNHSGWPVTIRATLRSLPSWPIVKNSAADPPPSPACAAQGTCGPPQSMMLVPHGASDLRIGMFPLV